MIQKKVKLIKKRKADLKDPNNYPPYALYKCRDIIDWSRLDLTKVDVKARPVPCRITLTPKGKLKIPAYPQSDAFEIWEQLGISHTSRVLDPTKLKTPIPLDVLGKMLCGQMTWTDWKESLIVTEKNDEEIFEEDI